MNSKMIGYILIGLFPFLIGTSYSLSRIYQKQVKIDRTNTPKIALSWTAILKKRAISAPERPFFPLAVSPKYRPFSEMTDGKRLWGYLAWNKGSSSVFIAPKFDEAEPFYQNIRHDPDQAYKKLHAIVTLNGKKGLIDETGKFVLKPEYDLMNRTVGNESNLIIRKGKDYKLLIIPRRYPNHNLSRRLSQTPYQKIEEYPVKHHNLKVKRRNMLQPPTIYYRTKRDGKTGLLSQSGRTLYAPKFDKLFPFNVRTGHAIAKKRDTYFIIDLQGRAIPLPFDDIQLDYQNHLFFARLDGLYGLYSITGKKLAKPAFDEFGCFPTKKDLPPMEAALQPVHKRPLNKALYTVRKGKLWGVIANNGKLAMSPQYDKLDCFKLYQNFTLATKNGTSFRVCFDGTRPPKDTEQDAGRFCQRRMYDWRKR